MAQIHKPNLHFNTKLYTGTGSSNAITGVGFQPDWVWGKQRSGTNSYELYDAVRGVNKIIYSDLTDAEGTNSNGVSAFNADGFTVAGNTSINLSGQTVVAWNWKANGAGSSNYDGSITSTVSANTTAGFSIVKWTGTGANATVGHGIGSALDFIIVKNRATTNQWCIYNRPRGATKFIHLDATDSESTASSVWNNTEPTSSVFSVGVSALTNGSSNSMIAYCFAEKKGYSKFGSYTGNGNADGTFIYTGFKPALIIFKRADSTGFWRIVDNKRDVDNVAHHFLFANDSSVESTAVGSSQYDTDILSNGFKIRTTLASSNASGGTFIYMAFAENPIVGSNNIPTTAK